MEVVLLTISLYISAGIQLDYYKGRNTNSIPTYQSLP